VHGGYPRGVSVEVGVEDDDRIRQLSLGHDQHHDGLVGHRLHPIDVGQHDDPWQLS
jgi:hypothetical protein